LKCKIANSSSILSWGTDNVKPISAIISWFIQIPNWYRSKCESLLDLKCSMNLNLLFFLNGKCWHSIVSNIIGRELNTQPYISQTLMILPKPTNHKPPYHSFNYLLIPMNPCSQMNPTIHITLWEQLKKQVETCSPLSKRTLG
jgi:hypothetical protein